MAKTNYEVLVIGCGPGGISAALPLKDQGVDVAIIEKAAPGGKINIAPRVDNYPGYPKILGPDLAMVFFQRVLDHKIPLIADEVISLTKDGDIFTVTCQKETYTAKAVIIASGTKENKLGLPNEDKLFAHGLSYCALCDGHFFRDQTVAIIGGGNVALKEAIYLADIVKKLYVIHRRNEFRGNIKLVEQLKSIPNVEILTPYVTLEILEKDDKVSGLVLQNKEDNSLKTLTIQGLFPLVGQIPNSTFVHIDGVLDIKGTIPYKEGMETNVSGLYVVGDITPRDIRQAYLAEHDGKVAAQSVYIYLNGGKE